MKAITQAMLTLCISSLFTAVLAANHATNASVPVIRGAIGVNTSTSGPLTMTSNQITVPNSFPTKITDTGIYSVQPKLPDPFTHWTKKVTYQFANGDGCSIAFAWAKDTKTDVVNATPLTSTSDCETQDDGSVITIGSNKTAR